MKRITKLIREAINSMIKEGYKKDELLGIINKNDLKLLCKELDISYEDILTKDKIYFDDIIFKIDDNVNEVYIRNKKKNNEN